jgi:predicted O-methyltransferase YrrM
VNKWINKVCEFVSAVGYTPHAYPLPIGMIVSEWQVLAKYALLAPHHLDNTLVEIGSFFGGSACILAACSQIRHTDNNTQIPEQIVSIDRFQLTPIDKGLGSVQNYHVIMNKIGWDRYHLINEVSQNSRPTYDKEVNKPISFLFIDGGHRYLECKGDFEAYHDLVVPGGYICFHDCGDTDKEDLRTEAEIVAQNNEYDVTPFCKRVCDNYSGYTCVQKVYEGNSIFVVQKQ